MKLCRVASPRTGFLVTNAINQALFDAEMEMYEHYNAPTRNAYSNMPLSTTNMASSVSPMTYYSSIGIAVSQTHPVHSSASSQSSSPAYSQTSSIFSECFMSNYPQQSFEEHSCHDDDPTH
ncbi:unnamed protein product [Acanthoscelides obtectus]|uniref:Uncharacterized protein n=1 Tax=Acanthoscelides obtectus TaxID=200917 RepID=A0A9P0KPY3_ACAOB|nr:unnamed protein product [Acanthoscelides obtectus]CAK1655917.1 hypothetical protein AOBTE_LOCUS19436 [Acanthoscelides obtectus]